MDDVDLVLVMSINPGLRRPELHDLAARARSSALRAMIDATGRDIPLEVDGGVTPETAPLVRRRRGHGPGGRHRGVPGRPERLRRQHPRPAGRLRSRRGHGRSRPAPGRSRASLACPGDWRPPVALGHQAAQEWVAARRCTACSLGGATAVEGFAGAPQRRAPGRPAGRRSASSPAPSPSAGETLADRARRRSLDPRRAQPRVRRGPAPVRLAARPARRRRRRARRRGAAPDAGLAAGVRALERLFLGAPVAGAPGVQPGLRRPRASPRLPPTPRPALLADAWPARRGTCCSSRAGPAPRGRAPAAAAVAGAALGGTGRRAAAGARALPRLAAGPTRAVRARRRPRQPHARRPGWSCSSTCSPSTRPSPARRAPRPTPLSARHRPADRAPCVFSPWPTGGWRPSRAARRGGRDRVAAARAHGRRRTRRPAAAGRPPRGGYQRLDAPGLQVMADAAPARRRRLERRRLRPAPGHRGVWAGDRLISSAPPGAPGPPAPGPARWPPRPPPRVGDGACRRAA